MNKINWKRWLLIGGGSAAALVLAVVGGYLLWEKPPEVAAPNPVLTTIRYFRDEYDAHIREKRCPAHECAALKTFSIDAAKCKGCTMCAKKCPAGAITGSLKNPHAIDPAKCVKCGACAATCKFGAVEVL